MLFFNKKNKLNKKGWDINRKMLYDNMNFAAAESYKLLRTNLIFSFPDISKGCVIGITSSMRGEGKSMTSINLSYFMAEAGKKVLLLEADLRLPSISDYLNIPSSPGLSNLLVGLNSIDKTVCHHNPQPYFDIIAAGDISPNPSELLGSKRMKAVMDELTKYYDYIIIDLPPVEAVADPLIISKYLNGMIIVVRDNYARRSALADTIRQLKFINIRILGFVFNNSKSRMNSKKYGKHYGRYTPKNEKLAENND